MLKNCRIILVRTHFPGNLGAVARVMRNFGLEQLYLVNPVADPKHGEAQAMATKGLAILENAVIVDRLDSALADCKIALATSANVWGLCRNHSFGRPDEVLPELAEILQMGPGGLVFGPEPTGLSNEEIAECHGIVRILTDREYPALNLAQSVAICLYELHRQWLHLQGAALKPTQAIAPHADLERMMDSLRESLEAVHFLYGTKADSLFYAIRHLIARARPSPNEVRILFGLARQLQWFAAHGTASASQADEHDDD
jgi:tRNA/rRNA methyltransferase